MADLDQDAVAAVENLNTELSQVPMQDENGNPTPESARSTPAATMFKDWLSNCGLNIGDINILIGAFHMPTLTPPHLALKFFEFFVSM